MSWLDWTLLRDLSSDGRVMTFDETGQGGGPHSSVYMRRTDGSPAVRLGDGTWPMLSHDGKWIACIQGDPSAVAIVPTGAGESRRVATPGVTPLSALWFPDGRRLLIAGTETGHALRYYVVPLEGGTPRAVTPEGASPFIRELSPDGRYVLTHAPGGFGLFPVDGGAALPVKGLAAAERVAGMRTPDSAYAVSGQHPMIVTLVDLKTGTRRTMLTIDRPADSGSPFQMRMTPDGRTYAYVFLQISSELFLMRNATVR
jgi:Tol biopolymer transport system component